LIIICISLVMIFFGLFLTLTGTSKYVEQYGLRTPLFWFIGILLGISLVVFILSKIKKIEKVSYIKIRSPHKNDS